MASNLLIYTNVPKVADERICPICSEEAPPGEVHHPHYGGICCYGCRAFFRRAHQRTKIPKLNCKGNGNCEIAPKGQARCKKCRYEKCLTVGMDPKWVMTNEQKRIRFQHYYKKKQERESQGGASNNSENQPSRSGESVHRAERRPRRPSKPYSTSESSNGSASGHSLPELIPVPPSLSPDSEPTHIGSNPVNNDSFDMINTEDHTRLSQTILSPNRLPLMLPMPAMPFERQPEVGQMQMTPEMAAQRLLMLRSLVSDEARGFRPSPFVNPRQRILDLMMEQQRMAFPTQAFPPTANHHYQMPEHNIEQPVNNVESSPQPPPPQQQRQQQQQQQQCAVVRQQETELRFADLLSLECQLTRLLDMFTLTIGKMDTASQPSKDLILAHQRVKPLSKMALISQVSKSASVITEFATSLPAFKRLNAQDRVTLLKSNVPLYLQYILARYFCAHTGLDQLMWIFEGQINFGDNHPPLHRIDLQIYQVSANLFPRSDMAEMYGHYAENISTFFRIPLSCNALVANLLLFRTTESTRSTLEDPDRVVQLFDEAVSILRLGHEHLDDDTLRSGLDEDFRRLPDNILPLIHSLDTMKNIFDKCQIDGDDVTPAPQARLSPDMVMSTYTETEEDWLINRLNQFQNQYQSVKMPGNYISQVFKLLQNGTPVNSNFIPDLDANIQGTRAQGP